MFAAGPSPSLLSAKITELKNEHHISAVAYFITSPDEVLELQTIGTLGPESQTPITPHSIFRIGSITKSFTALTSISLAADGYLDLSKPVTTYLSPPPFVNPWRERAPVTIEQLLEHTAGLHDLSKKEFDFNEPVSIDAAFRIDPDSRTLAWQPGLHSSYSNSGAGVVAAAIEATGSKSFEHAMRTRVFEPIGMNDTSLRLDATPQDRFIRGFDADGTTPIPYWHTLYRGFGAVNSTLADMLKYVKFYLGRGRLGAKTIISAATIARMETPRTTLAAKSGLTYGYGLGIYQFQRDGFSFFGHGGDADGYLSYFAYSKALERGYFIVINAYNNRALKQMRSEIETVLIENSLQRPKNPPAFKLDASSLKRLIGKYQQATKRFRGGQFGNESLAPKMRVYESGGKIYTRIGDGKRRELVAVNDHHFRRPSQTIATIALVAYGGKDYLQGDFGNFVKTAD